MTITARTATAGILGAAGLLAIGFSFLPERGEPSSGVATVVPAEDETVERTPAQLAVSEGRTVVRLPEAIGSAEALEVSASTGSPLLAVRTLDESGVPLPGVELSRRDAEGVTLLGKSDERGLATIPFPTESWDELLGSKKGYAAAGVTPKANREGQDPLILRLPQAGELTGVVTLPDGTPVGRDVSVLAFPMSRTRAMFLEPTSWVFQDPEALMTETDVQGRYVLQGLDPAEHYTLFAGGKGYVMSRPLEDVHAGAEVPDLIVHTGYGLLVQLREPDGSVPEIPYVYGVGVGTKASFVDNLAFFPRETGVSSFLSGFPHDPGKASPWDLLYIGAGNEPLPHVALDFSVHPPGYAPVETRLKLKPLKETIEVATITLVPQSEEWGSVVVERVRDVAVPEDTRWQPFASLTLLDEHGKRWSYPLTGAHKERHVLQRVPQGRYRASIRARPAFYRMPESGEELWIDVGPEPVVIPWGRSDLGALHFALSQAPGAPSLELTLTQDRGEHTTGSRLSFRRPPYVVPFLEPGTYTAVTAGPDGSSVAITAEVRPGQDTRILLDS